MLFCSSHRVVKNCFGLPPQWLTQRGRGTSNQNNGNFKILRIKNQSCWIDRGKSENQNEKIEFVYRIKSYKGRNFLNGGVTFIAYSRKFLFYSCFVLTYSCFGLLKRKPWLHVFASITQNIVQFNNFGVILFVSLSWEKC